MTEVAKTEINLTLLSSQADTAHYIRVLKINNNQLSTKRT